MHITVTQDFFNFDLKSLKVGNSKKKVGKVASMGKIKRAKLISPLVKEILKKLEF